MCARRGSGALDLRRLGLALDLDVSWGKGLKPKHPETRLGMIVYTSRRERVEGAAHAT